MAPFVTFTNFDHSRSVPAPVTRRTLLPDGVHVISDGFCFRQLESLLTLGKDPDCSDADGATVATPVKDVSITRDE